MAAREIALDAFSRNFISKFLTDHLRCMVRHYGCHGNFGVLRT